MRSFLEYYIHRSAASINENNIEAVKQQMVDQVRKMANGIKSHYPDQAAQLEKLGQQFAAGQIDPQMFSSQVSAINQSVQQLGPAFGGQQQQTPAAAGTKKPPILGAAFGGQQQAPASPMAKKPMLGPAFGG